MDRESVRAGLPLPLCPVPASHIPGTHPTNVHTTTPPHAQEQMQKAPKGGQHQQIAMDVNEMFDDAELQKLHEERIAKLRAEKEKRQQMSREGHGELQEITEGDFLETVTRADLVVCHFFHRDFERCKLMDKHLAQLAPRYFATRFVKLSAPVGDRACFEGGALLRRENLPCWAMGALLAWWNTEEALHPVRDFSWRVPRVQLDQRRSPSHLAHPPFLSFSRHAPPPAGLALLHRQVEHPDAALRHLLPARRGGGASGGLRGARGGGRLPDVCAGGPDARSGGACGVQGAGSARLGAAAAWHCDALLVMLASAQCLAGAILHPGRGPSRHDRGRPHHQPQVVQEREMTEEEREDARAAAHKSSIRKGSTNFQRTASDEDSDLD